MSRAGDNSSQGDKGMSHRKQIAVVGSGEEISDEIVLVAERVGELLAEEGAVLICGGKRGVMEAACRGAKRKGGVTVGILPNEVEEANPHIDIAIVTGMGDARNVINVKSADALIAIHGGSGTLSEIALALKEGKRVVAIKTSGGVSEKMASEVIGNRQILSANSADEAVRIAMRRKDED